MLCGMQDLSSLIRMELLFPVMEVWSLNHRTSRECPYIEFSENQLSIIAVKRAKQNETQFS